MHLAHIGQQRIYDFSLQISIIGARQAIKQFGSGQRIPTAQRSPRAPSLVPLRYKSEPVSGHRSARCEAAFSAASRRK